MNFDKIIALVDSLTPLEQKRLTNYLLGESNKHRLSVEEKINLLRSAQIEVSVLESPPLRREDWYGDDGR